LSPPRCPPVRGFQGIKLGLAMGELDAKELKTLQQVEVLLPPVPTWVSGGGRETGLSFPPPAQRMTKTSSQKSEQGGQIYSWDTSQFLKSSSAQCDPKKGGGGPGGRGPVKRSQALRPLSRWLATRAGILSSAPSDTGLPSLDPRLLGLQRSDISSGRQCRRGQE
ncbi:unnamed protein product, partial [Rangifer tarandus platyrhynchus]